MIRSAMISFRSLLLLTCAYTMAGVDMASAQELEQPLEITTDIKGQYLFEDNLDLGTGNLDSGSSKTLDGRVRLDYTPTELLEFFGEVGLVKVWGEASSASDETGASYSAGKYAEMHQAWVKYSELGGVVPLDVQLGRQRIREPYAFMWNRNLDALRLNYNSTLVSGFVGVGENLYAYRTSEDDFRADDQDITHYMSEIVWNYTYGHHIDLRVLHSRDHSGTQAVGDIVEDTTRDDEDEKLTWLNMRTGGEYPVQKGVLDSVTYRVDGAVVFGKVTDISTSSLGAGTDQRRVTGAEDRDVAGWAFDADAALALNVPVKPSLLFGYAYGSGDNGSGDDSAFRMPSLGSSRSMQGVTSIASHNYGEAFRGELSNLHIFKAGLGVPLMDASDVSLIYRYYMLDDETQGTRSAQVSAPVSGTDSSLGQGVDLIYNVNLTQESEMFAKLPADSVFKVSVGVFEAGSAYGVAEDEHAFRGTVDLRFRF